MHGSTWESTRSPRRENGCSEHAWPGEVRKGARPPSSSSFLGCSRGFTCPFVSRVSRSHRQVDYRESLAELLSWFSLLGPSVVELSQARGSEAHLTARKGRVHLSGESASSTPRSPDSSLGRLEVQGLALVLLILPCPCSAVRSCWPCRRRAGPRLPQEPAPALTLGHCGGFCPFLLGCFLGPNIFAFSCDCFLLCIMGLCILINRRHFS